MLDDYGTINVQGQNIEIRKLSPEELRKYLTIVNDKEKKIINTQNEYISQLLG
ncbi:MAG: hypothetical protein IJ629_04505 [Clostridia bacterium]|nr:hypothetical protein [Clostridia bacterium]